MVLEPVLENIAIVVPDEGYLAGVRAACDAHGVVLIFDEVKTGLTAGYAGASQRLGIKPDLVTLAKSIGGGFPLAAFGGARRSWRSSSTAGWRTSAPTTATRW
jgi:glutamate-1-semialdehyde 2,1-aminomutase